MAVPHTGPLVAVLNSSQDIVQLLQEVLEDDGFRTVTFVSGIERGPHDSLDFLRQHRPQIVLYSVAPPYDKSWAIFQQVREGMPDAHFVVTTTNKRALDEFVGPTDTLELIGKPFDLDEITAAVRRAGAPTADGVERSR